MRKELRRSIVSGVVQPQPSVAMAHRAAILASVSMAHTVISNAPVSSSLDATLEACKKLGADIVSEEGMIDIIGAEPVVCPREISCGTSAATLRLMMPFATLFAPGTTFRGDSSLADNLLSAHSIYLSSFSSSQQNAPGSDAKKGGAFPFSLSGPIESQGIVYPAGLGSQLLSGLLLSAPLRGIDTEIGIDGRLAGWGMVERTLKFMWRCGIESTIVPHRAVYISGSQEYAPPDEIAVPSNWCEPSYCLLAGALSGKVEAKDVHIPALDSLFTSFGASVSRNESGTSVSAGMLEGRKIDISSAPDFLPHAMVLASAANAKTEITGMALLHRGQKERAILLARELSRMGARIEPTNEGMRIEGGRLAGAEIEPEGDAHTAMACSVAALAARGPTLINGAECIERAHPNFFRHLSSIGAIVRETA